MDVGSGSSALFGNVLLLLLVVVVQVRREEDEAHVYTAKMTPATSLGGSSVGWMGRKVFGVGGWGVGTRDGKTLCRSVRGGWHRTED